MMIIKQKEDGSVEAEKTLAALQKSAKIARREITDDGLLREFLDKYLELEELLKNGRDKGSESSRD